MKKFAKISLLLLLVLTMALCFVACGEEPDNGGNKPGSGSSGGGGGGDDSTLQTIYTNNVTFNPKVVAYDGRLKTHENYRGKPEPEADERYEYWLNGEKVADEEGVSEVGIYEVRLYFSHKGYKETYVTSTLTIEQSYAVLYQIGVAPGADANAEMTVSENNPDEYATSTTGATLYNATLAGYKFKGWYTDAACTEGNEISEINGADFQGQQELTLYAKFQKYLPYPTPYQYSTTVTEEPTLPPIPGYWTMALKDSFKLVDLSMLAEGAEKSDHPEFKYGSTTSAMDPYYITRNYSTQLSDGNYALQWVDYNDTWEVENWMGQEDQFLSPGDGEANQVLRFWNPNPVVNPSNYDTIEFWIYCANTTVCEEFPEGNYIQLWMWSNDVNTQSMRIKIQLDFSGWKKFTLNRSDFDAPAGGDMNITRIDFYADRQSGFGDGNLAHNTNPNFVYFSDFFLTNSRSSYGVTTSVGSGAVVETLENLAGVTEMPLAMMGMTDTDIAQLLDGLDMSTPLADGAVSCWSDITITSAQSFYQITNRFTQLASAWNAPDSDYYHDEALLTVLGEGLNYLSAYANAKADLGAATFDGYAIMSCYNLATVIGTIGDYFEATHAETWCHAILTYIPSPVADLENMEDSAAMMNYAYTVAQMGLQNIQGTLTGLRAMASQLSQRNVTMLEGNYTFAPTLLTMLLAATEGTNLNPANPAFLNDICAWFYECVDALTLNGVSEATDSTSLGMYVGAMLNIYHMLPEAQQQNFSKTVKYYLAADPTLAANMIPTTLVQENLQTILADGLLPEKVVTSSVTINEKIGQVIYKTDDSLFALTQSGNLIDTKNSGFAVNTEGYEVFKGCTHENLLALVADDNLIVLGPDGATTSTESALTVTVGNTTAYLLSEANNAVTVDGLFMAADAPCILFTTENADGSISCTLYNYQGVATDMHLMLRGYYNTLEANDALEVSVTSNTTLTVKNATVGAVDIVTFVLIPL